MSRLLAWLAALACFTTSSLAVAQEPAPSPAPPAPPASPAPPAPPAPPSPTDVKLDLVIGEVKMLALDDAKSWTVSPEVGLAARAVDEGHTLRLVAQKDGLYTIRIERNDGTTATYAVRVGKEAVAAVAPPPPPPPVDPNAPKVSGLSADEKYTRNTIDLNLEGGGGRYFGEPAATLAFGRARAGVMFARWPVFTMIGATYEYNGLSPTTFGVQGELLHLSAGIWGQVGGMVDIHAKPGVMASFGFSIVGVEAQYRGYEDKDYGFAVLGKIRVPVGVLLYALDINKKK
ncbi:hypothetical protein BH11MYX4_BH11MYX4_40710 [soil metagenome]